MYLYIIFFILVILAFAEVVLGGIKYRTSVIYACVFILVILSFIVLSSLRWETGTDWETYYNFFLVHDTTKFISWLEPGYTFLSSSISETTGSYTILLFSMALLIISLKSRVINKYSIYPFFSVLIWWSTYMADIFPVRQTIAIAMTLYSIIYIIGKNKLKFMLVVCLALSFHASAFIFFAAYWVFHLEIKRKYLICGILVSYVFAFFASNLIHTILGNIGFDFLQERIQNYMEDGGDHTHGGLYTSSQILMRGLINKLFLFVPIFTYLWNKYDDDSLFRGWVNLLTFGTILSVCLVPISPALARLGMYYDVAIQIFIIPYLLKFRMTQFSKFFFFSIIVLYLLIRFSGVVANYEHEYIPYQSIFNI